MRKMKDSGIEWIGQIPSDWKSLKLQYACEAITDYTASGSFADLAANVTYLDDEDYAMLVRTADLSAKREMGHVYVDKHAYDYLHNSNLYGGEIILPNIGSVGSVYYYEPMYEYATLAPNAIMLRTESNRYLYYLFLTKPAEEALNRLSNATTQAKFNKTQLRKMKVILPDKNTQNIIVAFLDSKCAEIDALSADIQKEIETLEAYKRSVITEAVTKGLDKDAIIKNSEIFYMAPYNADWNLSKIGYECTKLWRSFEPEDTPLLCTNKGKVSIRPEEMSGRMVSEDNAMQGIHKGDIAIHGMDTWHGAIALSEFDGKITRVVHVCDSSNDKRFIVYYLQQLAFNGVYKLISNGVRGNTSDFRSWDKVADIYIALPSKPEQVEIANYLDAMCNDVESIVVQKQKQLTVLADYKKSLIYEYVTGKKEVPTS